MTIQMSANECSVGECANLSSAAHDAVTNTLNYKSDSKYDISIKIEIKERASVNNLTEAE